MKINLVLLLCAMLMFTSGKSIAQKTNDTPRPAPSGTELREKIFQRPWQMPSRQKGSRKNGEN